MVFELLINAVKVATSKDAREDAASLIEFLRRSPDWEKSIGTIEARISADVRERVQLIEDLVADKLKSLEYRPVSIEAFRTSIAELAANAFEHGVSSSRRELIKIVVETSPTYVATTVHNPKSSKFRLESALELATERRVKSHNTGRGRGLALVSRRVDVVQMVGEEAIKTLVYHDAVEIATHKEEAVLVAVLTAGHSNPSLARRIRGYLDEHIGKKIVLCLDPRDFDVYRRKIEDRSDRGVPKTEMVYLVLSDVQKRNAKNPDICIVGQRDMRDLLPEVAAARTIEAAIVKVKLGRLDV